MIKPCYGKCDYCGATQIDREALLHDIEQSVVYTARGKITSAEMRGAHKIIERIKCAPAVEPIYIHEPTKSEFKRMAVQMGYVQVVHGRCPICSGRKILTQDCDNGYSVEVDAEQGEMSIWQGDTCLTVISIDYCPNCGAKMDGGEVSE